MHAEDADDAIALHERIEEALAAGDATSLKEAEDELRELLFFVETG